MNWFRSVLAHFGFARQLPTSDDLRKTWPKHRRAISKADRVIADYRRQDGLIELRVVRRSRSPTCCRFWSR